MKTMWRKWRKAHLFYSTIFIGALNTAFDVKYHFFHFILLSNNVSLCMATASETPKAHTHTHGHLSIPVNFENRSHKFFACFGTIKYSITTQCLTCYDLWKYLSFQLKNYLQLQLGLVTGLNECVLKPLNNAQEITTANNKH